MKRSFFTLLSLSCLMLVGVGCYTAGDGGLKVGVPFGKDTIVSRYERPYDQVKRATIAVLKRNGTLTSDDLVKKVLAARIDTHTIWVQLDDSEPRIVKVSVQARTNGGGPDVDMASEIDKQIYGELITR
ncbi:MAG TPA: hypothetical protein VJW76_02935 [Verrucomicrobiae bacterium]|nr:hypothetical protein [Verrucomicrobiae bacterium]